MSNRDDSPLFKVTDKRLFNPDGTPRQLSEEPEETAATLPPTPAGAVPQVEPEPQPAKAATPPTAPPPEPDPKPSAAPGSIDFPSFIYHLATNAFANLGVMPHPMTGEATVDLETAKHFIDIIGLLEQKTKGNLTREEEVMMVEILRDLRLQYVSLVNSQKSGR